MESDFTKKEMSFIRKMKTPEKVQEFIETLTYNTGDRIPIIDVLRKRRADCLEAAVFAALLFKINGYDSFIVDFEAFRDEDHVICTYKKGKLYGSVAQSKYIGLKYRSPVYRTLRELSMSYFEHYFDYNGRLSLRNMSIPLKIPKCGKWIHKKSFLIELEKKLQRIKHVSLVLKNIDLPPVSKEVFRREIQLLPKDSKVSKRYASVIKDIKRI
jgi:hypothetical protein